MNGSFADDESVMTSDDGISVEVKEERDEVKEVKRMTQREHQHVMLWRWVVLLMILATACFLTGLTYTYLSREDTNDFEQAFDLFALTILNGFTFHTTNLMEAHKGLSETITKYALSSGSEWPFVTLPDFEVMMHQRRRQTNVEIIHFLPIVPSREIDTWANYSAANIWWLEDSLGRAISETPSPFVYRRGVDNKPIPENATDQGDPVLLKWQISPPPSSPTSLNFNFLSRPYFRDSYDAVMMANDYLISGTQDANKFLGDAISQEDHDAFHAKFKEGEKEPGFANKHPHGFFFYPVYSELDNKSSAIVAFLRSVIPWDRYLENLLPEGAKGIDAVLYNSCGQTFTYALNGVGAHFLGEGDMHDSAYDKYRFVVNLATLLGGRLEPVHEADCLYSFAIYPTSELENEYTTSTPLIFSLVVAGSFVLMLLTFFAYEMFVRRKNEKIVKTAAKSNAIVTSLFPSTVRDRIMDTAHQREEPPKRSEALAIPQGGRNRLKKFFASDSQHVSEEEQDERREDTVLAELLYETEPIADLFPETTIMFSDIAGFTAWSSVRDPSQVFTLLETIYRAFDIIAKRRRVFKVETIGDCYMAVCGLPEPRRDHAVVMSRFAQDCLHKFRDLANRLEVTLGPETGELDMRFGLHSGPVTAGVLRGERSRFQLFGDSVNFASRMESTGEKGRIQVSEETANILVRAGKSRWLAKRENKVFAKGKGELQTYWLEIGQSHDSSCGESSNSVDPSDHEMAQEIQSAGLDGQEGDKLRLLMSDKACRLIEFNAQCLAKLLRQIVARREALTALQSEGEAWLSKEQLRTTSDGTVLDEVTEIIRLPSFDPEVAKRQRDPKDVILGPLVEEQLLDYVTSVAAMYRSNSFHNFEHASHVALSANKLLSRIVLPSDLQVDGMHDHTYGITSSPLTQFACVFSALIHDVDHQGVPNTQLAKEDSPIAGMYKNRSIAEQNSLDLSWNLLMDKKYDALRQTICATRAEMQHFRQLVVNMVMATDIMDQDLKALRNERWDKAFSIVVASSGRDSSVNRKVTIVIEHLIQASDVCHTMQHWHVYQKWNEKLFFEMSSAFHEGRADSDPAENWYRGELGFFDHYIIPLAKKLKDCGVFGVSSDEYLDYAEKNRAEWEKRGPEVVSAMVEKCKKTQQSD